VISEEDMKAIKTEGNIRIRFTMSLADTSTTSEWVYLCGNIDETNQMTFGGKVPIVEEGQPFKLTMVRKPGQDKSHTTRLVYYKFNDDADVAESDRETLEST